MKLVYPNRFGEISKLKLKKPVDYEPLTHDNEYWRKYGFTGFVVDSVDDRRWLVHASCVWVQLFKNKQGIWNTDLIMVL